MVPPAGVHSSGVDYQHEAASTLISIRAGKRHGLGKAVSITQSACTNGTCNGLPASAYIVGMRKTPRVVPITSSQWRLIAIDEESSRMIFGIGERRFAFDFLSRVTELPRHTGDRPAHVVALKKPRK